MMCMLLLVSLGAAKIYVVDNEDLPTLLKSMIEADSGTTRHMSQSAGKVSHMDDTEEGEGETDAEHEEEEHSEPHIEFSGLLCDYAGEKRLGIRSEEGDYMMKPKDLVPCRNPQEIEISHTIELPQKKVITVSVIDEETGDEHEVEEEINVMGTVA